MRKRLAIITTHPVQYYAPVFRLLHERKKLDIMVFYTWGEKAQVKFDPGFNKTIDWDIPLLEGYPFTWVENTSPQPGSHHYRGIINPGLNRQVQEWKPDAVLIFGWAWQSHLKAMRFFKGKVPVYFRGDSTLLDKPKGLKNMIRSIFLKWVYRHVDYALYTGTNNKAYFKKYGLKEEQLILAPHAVDNERFDADRTAEATALREKLNVKKNEVLVLFAGKLEAKKSPGLLLAAFLSLEKTGVHLLITGSGELEASLKLQAKNAASVHFMDFQNQTMMPVIYQACDLFCLPSQGPGETWGLAVNEAMASGKVVLVSDKVGCAIDLVKENVNGAIFKSGDLHELIRCLDELTGSKEKLAEMGRNAGVMIQDWNILNIANAIESQLSNSFTMARKNRK